MFFNNSRPDRAKRAGIKPAFSRAAIAPFKPYEFLTEFEVRTGGDRTLVYDVESYKNYFCVSFECEATQKVLCFENVSFPNGTHCYLFNEVACTFKEWAELLGFVIRRFLIVGFNSRIYDLPMVALALDGVPAWKLKEYSDELILSEEQKFDIRLAKCNHIDIIDVAPITASLKIYAGRLHCPRMQDLPFEPNATLTYEESVIVRGYNINDLYNTLLLYQHLKPQIDLRIALGAEYQLDLRSKSDSQVAEAVILGELSKLGIATKKPTIEAGKVFNVYHPPGLVFKTPVLQRVLENVLATDFVMKDTGHFEKSINTEEMSFVFAGKSYKIGMGGLHSQEKSVSHFATQTTLLIDRDVKSYYPAIILALKLFPPQLGEQFLVVLKMLMDRRLWNKDKFTETLEEVYKTASESLKIVINGILGKLLSPFSKFYAPGMNLQMALSGQLYQLMLIEMLHFASFEVVSANTDGVVTLVPNDRKVEFNNVCGLWESLTSFVTEETSYKSIHCRDVNNYIAVKSDGKCKVKGVYSEFGSALNSVLSKNPESLIVSDAVQNFLANGVLIEDTIQRSRDIRRFINVRTVKGGAQKNGIYLGKAIRWYYSNVEQGTINYVLSGNNVPKSEKAAPIMELPSELPYDLDIGHYINEATEVLYDVGYYKRQHQGLLI